MISDRLLSSSDKNLSKGVSFVNYVHEKSWFLKTNVFEYILKYLNIELFIT